MTCPKNPIQVLMNKNKGSGKEVILKGILTSVKKV
jgi:hypothetical protein